MALESELRKLEQQQLEEKNLQYKRSIPKMALPAPLVSDEEMERIAKSVGTDKIAQAANRGFSCCSLLYELMVCAV